MVTVSVRLVYYSVAIMYCMYYFGESFAAVLPWATCDNPWNTDKSYCFLQTCRRNDGIIINNGSCVLLDDLNDTTLAFYNVRVKEPYACPNIYWWEDCGPESSSDTERYDLSGYVDPFMYQRQSASEQYWR